MSVYVHVQSEERCLLMYNAEQRCLCMYIVNADADTVMLVGEFT